LLASFEEQLTGLRQDSRTLGKLEHEVAALQRQRVELEEQLAHAQGAREELAVRHESAVRNAAAEGAALREEAERLRAKCAALEEVAKTATSQTDALRRRCSELEAVASASPAVNPSCLKAAAAPVGGRACENAAMDALLAEGRVALAALKSAQDGAEAEARAATTEHGKEVEALTQTLVKARAAQRGLEQELASACAAHGQLVLDLAKASESAASERAALQARVDEAVTALACSRDYTSAASAALAALAALLAEADSARRQAVHDLGTLQRCLTDAAQRYMEALSKAAHAHTSELATMRRVREEAAARDAEALAGLRAAVAEGAAALSQAREEAARSMATADAAAAEVQRLHSQLAETQAALARTTEMLEVERHTRAKTETALRSEAEQARAAVVEAVAQRDRAAAANAMEREEAQARQALIGSALSEARAKLEHAQTTERELIEWLEEARGNEEEARSLLAAAQAAAVEARAEGAEALDEAHTTWEQETAARLAEMQLRAERALAAALEEARAAWQLEADMTCAARKQSGGEEVSTASRTLEDARAEAAPENVCASEAEMAMRSARAVLQGELEACGAAALQREQTVAQQQAAALRDDLAGARAALEEARAQAGAAEARLQEAHLATSMKATDRVCEQPDWSITRAIGTLSQCLHGGTSH